jgi:RNA polymerase sigma factor (TIGR02999 family)
LSTAVVLLVDGSPIDNRVVEKMMGEESSDAQIQVLLTAVENGEVGALDALIEAIYPDLKRLAHFQLSRERPGHTLNTTEIVHDAFLRMVPRGGEWNNRSHFMRAAARVMRHLLVDHARQRNAAKRGNGMAPVTLQDAHQLTNGHDLAVLDLDSAINDIAAIDPRLESVIECRYFAGLSVEETAATLGISQRSVERDWQRARGYIITALETDSD